MQPLDETRPIPQGERFFSVDLGEKLGVFHLRFPSYGKAARLLKLLVGFNKGDGMDRLASMLDVAGYAIGVCWWHRAYSLDAGTPPGNRSDEDTWRKYGDDVIDELQDHGLTLVHVMQMLNAVTSTFQERMTESGEAEEVAGE